MVADGDKKLNEIVDKGLEVLDNEENLEGLKEKKELLNEIKRHGLAIWRALVWYVLKDYPSERKKAFKDDPAPRK